MILTTHAIVGGAIASLMPSHPVLAVGAAFASHFVIDAIPHRDYPLRSISISHGHRNSFALSKPLLWDLGIIAIDGCAGLALALLWFAHSSTAIIVALCAIAGIAPDPLQFAHSLYPREPLKTLQKLHRWCHTKRQLEWLPGVLSQIAFAVVVAAIAVALR
jgi:hypothetical protein